MPETEFLRAIPLSLDLKQRIALEAVSFSLDAIIGSYNQIVYLLSQFSHSKISDINREERVYIFTNIWTMIDQTHLINQLLKEIYTPMKKHPEEDDLHLGVVIDEKKELEFIDTYLATYSAVISDLRNKMDHLRVNLNNLSNAKKIEPIHGSLSYICSNIEELRQEGIFHIVVLFTGNLTHKNHKLPVINPTKYAGEDINVPVDCLMLSAFGRKIYISELFTDTTKLKDTLNNVFGKRVKESLLQYAQENNLDTQEICKSGNSVDIVLVCKL
ncbi:MAG TPA: hypothetical protein V6C52_03865 [Coleofasciculaceae cyanobacterium]|jgi:hypothetical protein